MEIETKNLSFAFERDKEPILKDLSFRLGDDEICAIVGISGCGKTTLLRLIAGFLERTDDNYYEGEVLFSEANKRIESPPKGSMGFMFQGPSLLPNLTVEGNVFLPARMIGSSDPDPEALGDKLIALVGLDKDKEKLPKMLSGGMQTRVALARAFVTKPSLVLLDEPFSSLDIGWKIQLYLNLLELREEFRSAILMVTHDIEEALLLADRIIVLSANGSINAMIKVPTKDLDLLEIESRGRFLHDVQDTYLKIHGILIDERARALNHVD